MKYLQTQVPNLVPIENFIYDLIKDYHQRII